MELVLHHTDAVIKRSAKSIAIHFGEKKATPRIGEVWLVYLGHNIGHEQNGAGDYLRPFLVVSICGSMAIGVPLTSKSKAYQRNISCLFKERQGYLLCNHLKSLDYKRFVKLMGVIDTQTLQSTKKLLSDIFSIAKE